MLAVKKRKKTYLTAQTPLTLIKKDFNKDLLTWHWHQSSFQKLGALAYCLTQNVADHNYELSPVVFFEATPFAPGNQPFHEWWVSVETETSKLPNIYWDVEICSSFLRMWCSSRIFASLTAFRNNWSFISQKSHRIQKIRIEMIYEAYLKKEESTLVSM